MARRQLSDETESGMVTTPGIDPLLGATLDGRFKVVEPIGKGGMGRVYRAMQLPMNRPVALKVLDYNFGAGRDESFRQRFLVEAELTARLRHPNTITVIDYGCTKTGIFYIAMEYLEGDTLGDVLMQQGALPWRRVLSIGQQVARSLREAHSLGVVHRDLKPANVFLLDHGDDQDQVKVLDFGLVKSFVEGRELEGRAVTQQGMLMGSPPYMAPEQGDKNRADPRSDIYSLGVVLYEALTGTPPFTGRGAMEVILKHVHEPVPPMRTPPHLELIPPEMEALVRKCLMKSPMDRLQSMNEVLQAMQELASPAFATPGLGTPGFGSLLPAAAPPARRALYLPALLFLLAVGVGGAVTWVLRPRTQVLEVAPRKVQLQPLVPAQGGEAVDAAPVFFKIDSVPDNATVSVGGEVLGNTPLEFELPADPDGSTTADFLLELDGYLPVTVTAGGSGPTVEVIQRLAPVHEATPATEAPTPAAKLLATPPTPHPAAAAPVRRRVLLSAAAKKKLTERRKPKPAPAPASAAKLSDTDDEPTPADDQLKRPVR